MRKKKIKKSLISIITVVKNDEKKISKTIQSVIQQKNKKIEYIVIDGASKDKTFSIVKKYKKKNRYYISKER